MSDQKPPRGKGCFFYGCLTFVLITIGVMIGAYFGTKRAIKEVVKNYTGAAPAEIPVLRLSSAEQKSIADQIRQQAQQAFQPGGTPQELVLGERELNAMMLQSSQFNRFTNQLYLRPLSNVLTAHLSIPLDQFDAWNKLTRRFGDDLKGRYLNGIATLDPGITNGELHLTMKDVTVNGQVLPDAFISRLKSHNFAQEANNNADFRNALQHVRGLAVTNGQVRLSLAPPN